MAVEVNFQRQDSDSRRATRVLPATDCAILRRGKGRAETCPNISIVVAFIVFSWLWLCGDGLFRPIYGLLLVTNEFWTPGFGFSEEK